MIVHCNHKNCIHAFGKTGLCICPDLVIKGRFCHSYEKIKPPDPYLNESSVTTYITKKEIGKITGHSTKNLELID